MYLDDGKSVSVEWMNEWGGHRVRRTSFTIINTLLTHSFKRWFELVYVPLESYFLIAYLITKWELQPFLFSPTLCRCRVVQLPHFFGWMGMRVPRLFERDESERRLIQKVTQSEQQCCPLAELSLFPCIPWDAKLVVLLSSRLSDHTAQGFINLSLALSLD